MLKNLNKLANVLFRPIPFTCNFYTSTTAFLNCHRASIKRIGRLVYTKQYPTIFVFNDGSSISIRYHEPRKIIKLPLDLSLLTEEQRKIRLGSRKPKTKVIIEDDLEETFDLKSYEHLWKK